MAQSRITLLLNVRGFREAKAKINQLPSAFSSLTDKVKRMSAGFGKAKGSVDKFNKSARDASFSMGSMIKRSISLVAVLGGVFAAVELVKKAFVGAFLATEKYILGVAELTALTLSFIKVQPGESLADQYKRANIFAKGLFDTLQDIAATTRLTGEEVTTLANVLLRNRVILDVNNQKQVSGFKALANAVALVAAKTGSTQKQIVSEVEALMKGISRPGDILVRMLQGVDVNLKSNIQLWRRQGTVLENMTELLRGFDAVSSDIEGTWGAVSTKLQTTFERLSRTALDVMFEDIINLLNRLDNFLIKNRDQIVEELKKGYTFIRDAVKSQWEFWKNIFTTLRNIRAIFKEINKAYTDILPFLDSMKRLSFVTTLLGKSARFLASQSTKIKEAIVPPGEDIAKTAEKVKPKVEIPELSALPEDPAVTKQKRKFDAMIEGLLTFGEPKVEAIIRKAGKQGQKIFDAFLELPPEVQKERETELNRAFQAIQDGIFLRTEKLQQATMRKSQDFAREIESLTLRGVAAEEFAIVERTRKRITAREKELENIKRTHGEQSDLFMQAQDRLKSETEVLQTEKDKQIAILVNFTAKRRLLQEEAGIIGVTRESIQRQAEINRLRGDFISGTLNSIEALRKEGDILKLSAQAEILRLKERIEKEPEHQELLRLKIEMLREQLQIEQELLGIRVAQEEAQLTEFGAFREGLRQTITEFNDFNTQVLEFGKNTAQALSDSFGEFFFSAMKGELQSFRDFWRGFTDQIFRMLSQMLAKWLIVKAAMGLGGAGFLGDIGAGSAAGAAGGFGSQFAAGSANSPISFDNGGVVGRARPGASHVLGLLKPRERVLTEEENKMFEGMSGRQGQPPVIVNMNITATDADSFNSRLVQSKDIIANAMMGAMGDNHQARRSRV